MNTLDAFEKSYEQRVREVMTDSRGWADVKRRALSASLQDVPEIENCLRASAIARAERREAMTEEEILGGTALSRMSAILRPLKRQFYSRNGHAKTKPDTTLSAARRMFDLDGLVNEADDNHSQPKIPAISLVDSICAGLRELKVGDVCWFLSESEDESRRIQVSMTRAAKSAGWSYQDGRTPYTGRTLTDQNLFFNGKRMVVFAVKRIA